MTLAPESLLTFLKNVDAFVASGGLKFASMCPAIPLEEMKGGSLLVLFADRSVGLSCCSGRYCGYLGL